MNTKTHLVTGLLLLCLFFSKNAAAQHTGSYDTTIIFMGSPRVVSMYVPSTYTATAPHKLMICLHGLGDTCSNYRNALAGSLAWPTHFSNTIFVCPEAANRNTDYHYPAGGEAIIQASIDMARTVYNIDTDNVVLQGFSLGGRAALRYGLAHTGDFKGLLLNTPAVQGVKEAINSGAYTFGYASAPAIPIYITHGATDIMYTGPIDSTYEQLILNNGVVRYNDVAGLGHNIPSFASMADVTTFFDMPTHIGLDAEMVAVGIAQRTLATTLPASCLVRNTGVSTIHTISIDYTVGSTTLSHTWTGTLLPYEHAVISLPTISAPAGTYTLTAKVTLVDGVADTVTTNNIRAVPFQLVTAGNALPCSEGFEGTAFPPANWIQNRSGDIYCAWDRDNTVHKTGLASMTNFNTILIFDNAGRRDEMESPVLDLTSVGAPHVSFDVAYNYNHYTPPTLTVDTVFADTLSVLVSTDGGTNYTTVYKKGGAELATFPSPIMNPVSIAASFISPTASNWRTEDVDLSAYATCDKAIVKFCYTSALGGSINVDNVSFRNGPVVVPGVVTGGIMVYPVPARSTLHVSTGNEPLDEVVLTDMTGRQVLRVHNDRHNNETTIDVAHLPQGIYLLRVQSGARTLLTKVNIEP